MNSRSMALFVFLFLVVVIVFQIMYYYPRVPDSVASHFDAAGHPNGWSSKDSFFGIYAGTIIVTAVIFLGAGLWMRKIPAKYLSLPNREYWLAPERMEETMHVLSQYLFWLGILTMTLFIGIIDQVCGAGLDPDPRLERPWLYLGPYLIVTIAWTFSLVRKFWRV